MEVQFDEIRLRKYETLTLFVEAAVTLDIQTVVLHFLFVRSKTD
jgi:hypothetical protein